MVREGLRRLRAQDRIGAALHPDPGSDVGRVCALESTHYLRNQLLRDADWAGMAHGVEIRVPLADSGAAANARAGHTGNDGGRGQTGARESAEHAIAGRGHRARQDGFQRTDPRLA